MNNIQGIFFKDFETSFIPDILKEIYKDRIYKPYFDGKTDLTVMDCGANIGLFSMYAYPFAKKIYAIEPSQNHFETLNHMLKYNGMDDKVETIKKAISLNDGTATFYHNSNVTAYSLNKIVDDTKDGGETVETIAMDTLFTQYKISQIDFLKLDIEGAECEVIGSKGFEIVAPNIKNMVIEYHNWAGINANQVFTCLSDLGFKTRTIPSEAALIGATRE